MVGPVADNYDTGALWMAQLSNGVWSDVAVPGLSGGAGDSLQVGGVSCFAAGFCMMAVNGIPSDPLVMPFETGSWGPAQPLAGPEPSAVFSLACQWFTECTASVILAGYSQLETNASSQWQVISGTATGDGQADAVWEDVSCPTQTSCLAISQEGYTYDSPPQGTQISVSVAQTGPIDTTVTATVSWPALSPSDPAPVSVTYDVDGQPLGGCSNVALTQPSGSPQSIPGCDVYFFGGSDYSFSATVNAGGNFLGSTSNVVTSALQDGYWEVAQDSSVYTYGGANLADDSQTGTTLNKPIVGTALTPDDFGYWLVASDGGIFTAGDAPYWGSTGALHLNKPIVGMAATPDGGGYWLVASDGGIFSFGDAPFYGSTGALHLNKPIVGMAATPDGGGYWLVASDGGIFAFGDAPYFGSTGGIALNKPIVGMATTIDGSGYWLAASDGGIFTFGDARYEGSTGSIRLNKPITGMAPTLDGRGYWLVAADGGVFSFGDATFQGSAGGQKVGGSVVAITAS
jgi:hypothetical protein